MSEGVDLEVIGFIPAAGKGKRMRPFLLIKELLPIKYTIPQTQNSTVSLLFENSMQTFQYGGISSIVCVINKEKDDLRNYILKYSDENKGVQIAFVYQNIQSGKYGLPYAIQAASHFFKGKTVIMRFPDTVITPPDCLKDVLEFHRQKKADITLGVFSTKNPEKLAPVIIGDDDRVIKIEDKPQKPTVANTWNCVIWEESFLVEVLSYIEESGKDCEKELLLSDIIMRCVSKNMRVFAKVVKQGECYDYSSIDDFVQEWEK